MWRAPEPRYDVADGLTHGACDYQEDAVISDFPFGMDGGIAVLADGMGGHEAGDVASKLVLTEVYSTLKFNQVEYTEDESRLPEVLVRATAGANAAVRDYVQHKPAARGMGATLVAAVLVENRLYWMSVGDSPIYLLRDGKLQQLNEDHSLAPQIDYMAQSGLISKEAAKNHPDRNNLTSVIMGVKIPRSHCPPEGFELRMGDVVVMASDGLQYLEEDKIQKVVHKYRRKKSAEITGYLLEAIAGLNDPTQDNVSLTVIKLNHMKPVERKVAAKPIGFASGAGAGSTRVSMEDDELPGVEVANAADDEAAVEEEPKFKSKKGKAGASSDKTSNVKVVTRADEDPSNTDEMMDEPVKKRAAGAK